MNQTLNKVRQAHLEGLADRYNCLLIQKDKMPGMMYVEFGYVEGPIVQTQQDYLVMLHEVGHVARGHTQGRPPKTNKRAYFNHGVLRSEAEAWEFALDECKEQIEDSSRLFMWNECLTTYLIRSKLKGDKPDRLTNGNRHHVEFFWDTPDDYFYDIARRIKGNVRGMHVIF